MLNFFERINDHIKFYLDKDVEKLYFRWRESLLATDNNVEFFYKH